MRLRTLIIVLLGSSLLLGAEGKTTSCRSLVVAGELTAQESFEREIGGGLTFRLKPTALGAKGQIHGWEISIVRPEAPERDYIYPVNVPLRFNGNQILGASYGDDTKASLDRPHEMWFLLTKTDYDRLWPAVEHALWPYSAPHPGKTGDEFLRTLKSLETGWLEITVSTYDLEPESDSIRWIKFQVEFIVPGKFKLAPGLKTAPAACPAPPQ